MTDAPDDRAARLARLSPAQRALLDRRLAEASGVRAIPRLPPDQVGPLSFGQERVLFLQALSPASTAYNNPAVLRIRGPLRAGALADALAEIVRRHDVLRTRFVRASDGVLAAHVDARGPALAHHDLRGAPAAERESLTLELAEREARRPFDLSAESPLRLLLVRLTPDDHLLVIVTHLVAADGWSLGVLAREFGALYAAAAAGQPPPLPPLPIRYADFAAWQRQRVALYDHQVAYWEAALRDRTRLAWGVAREPERPDTGHCVPWSLDAPAAAALRRLALDEGATPFHVLLAALAALLGRHAGQTEVCIGTPVSGRDAPETEPLVGLFLNTLVLRVDLRGTPPFRELVVRARRVFLDAFDHREIPFERVVERLRARGEQPLFDVMLAMNNAPMASARIADLACTPVAIDNGAAKLAQSWLAWDDGAGAIAGTFTGHAAAFSAEDAARVAARFGVLLRAAVADPGRRIDALPLLPDDERRRLAAWSCGPDVRDPDDMDFAARFAMQVDRTPDAAAVATLEGSVSYRKLDEYANRIAWRLGERGVARGDVVGLCVGRRPALLAGLLGILKAGAAWLPLEPALPAERLRFMADDAGARHAVTGAAEADLAASIGLAPLVAEPDLLRDASVARPPPAAGAGDLAYVIYTSGSTGRPNGVAVEHAALCNLADAGIAELGVEPGARVLQFASIAFDASVWEIAAALAHGATLCLPPPQALLSGEALRDAMTALGVELAKMPPSVLHRLPPALPPALRTLISAGEPCPLALVEQRARDVALWNAYGPTEAACWATLGRLRAGERPTVGRPIAGVTVRVCDEHLQPVPIGVEGELVIGGRGLARGYVGRLELNRARFVRDDAGERVYRTGDRGRVQPDGAIELLGRRDRQVKVHGCRVELDEVEAVLRSHPAVREVAVEPFGNGDLLELAAFVAAPAPPVDELRRHLGARLPAHMLPTRWVQLAELPLTNSRKVDRQALRARLSEPPRGEPADPVRFCLPAWRLTAPVPSGSPAAPSRWWIIGDQLGVGDALAHRLTGDGECVVLVETTGGGPHILDPSDADACARLVNALVATGGPPDRVVYLAGLTEPETPAGLDDALARAARARDRGLAGLLHLAHALARHAPGHPIDLRAVAAGGCRVRGDEPLDPTAGLLRGAARVVSQEVPHLTCTSIDVDGRALAAPAGLAAGLAAACALPPPDADLALRDGACHVAAFAPVPLEAPGSPPWRERGTYLITGGFGGLGLAFAEHLARTARARLVLVGRTPPTGDRVRATLDALRAAGAEVLALTADVADPDAMRAALGEARARFGSVHGVIHAAGVPAGGSFLRRGTAGIAAELRPKVEGTLVLHYLLAGEPLDCLVLCSSLASVVGGFSAAGYAAASAFLDTFAHAAGPRAVSIDWCTWRDTGMAARAEPPPDLRPWLQRRLERGLDVRAGCDVLDRAVASRLPQILVSREPLDELRRRSRLVPGAASAADLDPGSGPRAASTPRPPLSVPFVAPRDPVEQRVAAAFRDVLRVEPVGADDDFFDLGGHSLLAARLAGALSETFQIELPLVVVLQHLTPAALARAVADLAGGPAAAAGAAAAADYVRGLSDAEVDAMLGDEPPS